MSTMATSWSHSSGLVSLLLEPSPLAIVVSLVVVLVIPLLLHFFIYRSTSRTDLPSFLIIGPSNSGKTSLLTYFERGWSTATHTSQHPISVEISLPVTTEIASSRFRSANDPSLHCHKRFLLVDTPGHGKLRHYALDRVVTPEELVGIIFVVDAANLSPGTIGLKETAEYLHDVLLLLQQRSSSSKTSRGVKVVPVLLAVNKLDLFTALPISLVKNALESEITSVRASKAKGLLDSGIAMNDADTSNDKDWLGDIGAGKFEFSQLEDSNIVVTIAGGNVVGKGADAKKWWEWIGSCL